MGGYAVGSWYEVVDGAIECGCFVVCFFAHFCDRELDVLTCGRFENDDLGRPAISLGRRMMR